MRRIIQRRIGLFEKIGQKISVGEQSMKTIQGYFDDASKYLNIKEDRLNLIKKSNNMIQVKMPLVRDDGSLELVTGYRCQHHNHKLPTKGGLQIGINSDRNLVEGMALLMTIKSSTLDIPHSGSFGAIQINKSQYSQREIEAILRRYTLELAKKKYIGVSNDVINIDKNVTENEINCIRHTYSQIFQNQEINFNPNAIVTGKTSSQGGIENRVYCKSLSPMIVLRLLQQNEWIQQKYGLKNELEGQKIIAYGWSQHVYNILKHLVGKGCRVIGVCDQFNNNVYDVDGLDIDQLMSHSITLNLGGHSKQTNLRLMEQQSDILIVKDLIDMEGLRDHEIDDLQINSKVVLESSNNPISYKMDLLMNQQGLLVVPDIISHSAPNITSYVEWIKSLSYNKPGRLTQKWQELQKHNLLEIVNETLGMDNKTLNQQQMDQLKGPQEYEIVETLILDVLNRALNETLQTSQNLNVNLRIAGYINAINRVNTHTRVI